MAGSIVELKVDVSIVNREGFDTLYAPPLAGHYLTLCIDRWPEALHYNCQHF